MTNPHRQKEELKYLPKKTLQHQNPQTRSQVLARPTDPPAVDPTQYPTQASTQNPEEETPPDLTEYIKSYQQAGKVWFDTVLFNEEHAYTTLFDTLLQLGDPHIEKFPKAD